MRLPANTRAILGQIGPKHKSSAKSANKGAGLALDPGALNGVDGLLSGFRDSDFVHLSKDDGVPAEPARDMGDVGPRPVFRDLLGEGGQVVVDDGQAMPTDFPLAEGARNGPFVEGGVDAHGLCFRTAPSLFVLPVDGVARCLVREGREIVVERARDGDGAVIAFLLGSVLAAWLQQRGVLAVHAGAVQFAGHAGQGKSTLLGSSSCADTACSPTTGVVPDADGGPWRCPPVQPAPVGGCSGGARVGGSAGADPPPGGRMPRPLGGGGGAESRVRDAAARPPRRSASSWRARAAGRLGAAGGPALGRGVAARDSRRCHAPPVRRPAARTALRGHRRGGVAAAGPSAAVGSAARVDVRREPRRTGCHVPDPGSSTATLALAQVVLAVAISPPVTAGMMPAGGVLLRAAGPLVRRSRALGDRLTVGGRVMHAAMTEFLGGVQLAKRGRRGGAARLGLRRRRRRDSVRPDRLRPGECGGAGGPQRRRRHHDRGAGLVGRAVRRAGGAQAARAGPDRGPRPARRAAPAAARPAARAPCCPPPRWNGSCARRPSRWPCAAS